MTSITTKRHPVKFFVAVMLGALFMFGMAAAVLLIYFDEKQTDPTNGKLIFMPLAAALVFGIGVYMVYAYFRNVPVVKLNADGITIRDVFYPWREIKDVALSGKQRFAFIGYFPMESVTLYLQDGRQLILFDELYQNGVALKRFIQQKCGEGPAIEDAGVFDIRKEDVDTDFYDIFKDHQLTSWRGIMLWGFVGYMIWITGSKPVMDIKKMGPIIIILVAFFLFFSWMMHYFKVGRTYFVVRNHNIPWINKVYRLDAIDEVIFETQGKLPYCLRVITKDLQKSRLFPAGTLRDDTWKALAKELRKKKIKVRNECV